MQIFSTPFSKQLLIEMQEHYFGDMVKAVVDVKQHLIAVDAEMHADLEQLLLSEGSQQMDLWGINLYPEMDGEDFVEFDSLINIRPYQNNRSRDVESAETKASILNIVNQLVQ